MVEVEVKTPVLTRIEEFHGHIGPYVVLGYKIGQWIEEIGVEECGIKILEVPLGEFLERLD